MKFQEKFFTNLQDRFNFTAGVLLACEDLEFHQFLWLMNLLECFTKPETLSPKLMALRILHHVNGLNDKIGDGSIKFQNGDIDSFIVGNKQIFFKKFVSHLSNIIKPVFDQEQTTLYYSYQYKKETNYFGYPYQKYDENNKLVHFEVYSANTLVEYEVV